jgi:hypothetical protein
MDTNYKHELSDKFWKRKEEKRVVDLYEKKVKPPQSMDRDTNYEYKLVTDNGKEGVVIIVDPYVEKIKKYYKKRDNQS